MSFRCLKIGRHLYEDFRGAGTQAGRRRTLKRRTSLRKYWVRGEQPMSRAPLEIIRVINKMFLFKQALETSPLPNYSIKWQISTCRLISQGQP